jgi:hypothetical protein
LRGRDPRPRFTISLKRSTQNLQLSTSWAGRLLHLSGRRKGDIIKRARSGVLGDELVAGSDGGHKPENAVNQYDDAALAAWVRDCLKITVRIDPRADGEVRAGDP